MGLAYFFWDLVSTAEQQARSGSWRYQLSHLYCTLEVTSERGRLAQEQALPRAARFSRQE